MTYNPAFMNTASCRSDITFIVGERGILRYRGYPIEMLAENCSFLEVADLLLFGDLPTSDDLNNWVTEIDIGYADGGLVLAALENPVPDGTRAG
jgi:citrate synthase